MVQVNGDSQSDSLISIRALCKTYIRGSESIDVLNNLNLDIDRVNSSPSWARAVQERRPF
jgi:hypothetical protein